MNVLKKIRLSFQYLHKTSIKTKIIEPFNMCLKKSERFFGRSALYVCNFTGKTLEINCFSIKIRKFIFVKLRPAKLNFLTKQSKLIVLVAEVNNSENLKKKEMKKRTLEGGRLKSDD